MGGGLEQLIFLACMETLRLNGCSAAPLDLSQEAFNYCSKVEFKESKTYFRFYTRLASIAEEPEAWHAYLVRKKVKKVYLVYQSTGSDDRMTNGFAGGGGHWYLCTLSEDRRCQIYAHKWVVGDRQAKDRRIWDVLYTAGGWGGPLLPKGQLEASRERLRKALKNIIGYCDRAHESNFRKSFVDAQKALDGPTNADALHSLKGLDLPPQVLTTLSAVQHASVFGAMGSWNDGVQGGSEADYEQVSEELFQALNEATVQAVDAVGQRGKT